MKLFYLFLFVEVVSGSLTSSFTSCFSQNGLVDGETTLYYSERCRSFKKTLTCMSDAVNSASLTWMETFRADDTIDRMKTNVGRACALARNQYCSSIYLEEKMKSCTSDFSQSSLDNLTEEYANLHYETLVTSLNCMKREIRICPDDEHIQTYLTGIKSWRTQLNQLSKKVEVVSGSLISSFKFCFSQNGLLDGKTTLYYSKRCRSFKKTLTCMSDAVNSPYLTWVETYAAEKTIDTMKTNVGRACALARNQYCSSIYLEGKMNSCTKGFSQSSLNNLTEEYANLHYGTLLTSLNCMAREILICPDDEHIQTYLFGIQTWRAQLNQLSQAYQIGPGLKSTSPKGLGLKPTSPKDPGWIVNGGMVHFGISPLILTILVILFY